MHSDTKSPTAATSARLIVGKVPRVAHELVAALGRHSPALVADVANVREPLPPRIRQLVAGANVCGPAVTCVGVDLTVRRAAIDLCEPGDVLVIAAGGDTSRACFGSYTARHMASLGIAGVVVDGAVRDLAELRAMRFPTFAAGSTPVNFDYPQDRSIAGVNVPAWCGDTTVHPGDIIMGDDDGVICVPLAVVADLVSRLDDAASAEADKWDRRQGQRYGAAALLLADGFEETV